MRARLLRHLRTWTLLAALAALPACSGGQAQPGVAGPPPSDGDAPVDAPPLENMGPITDPMPVLPGVDLDTIRAGRFNQGKMWTFEAPPRAFFEEEYGLAADAAWFEKARLAALRIPGCSASFVSADGLVLTNHHCARDFVSQVSEEGEDLLERGFYAAGLEEERPVEDFEADQLIEIVDVSDEVDRRMRNVPPSQRSDRREEIHEEIAERIAGERGGEDAGIEVEVISLYSGARTSAYVFRRYTDVKLVMAPELQMGFFGGDPDNFTYPRYNLDFALFRVYGEDGEPLESEHYFEWNTEGAADGDAVFIIGNPGSTSRLQTLAQLEFRRDVSDKATLAFLRRRAQIIEEHAEAHPEDVDAYDLVNAAFNLRNSEKAFEGQLAGLSDPVILAMIRDRERVFVDSIRADSVRNERYGDVLERMAEVQEEKKAGAAGYQPFLALNAEDVSSPTLHRGLIAFQLLNAIQQAAPVDVREDLEEQLLAVSDWPSELDEAAVRDRIEIFMEAYGAESDVATALLGGRSPEGAASHVVTNSVLRDSASTAEALEKRSIAPDDPAIAFVLGYLPPLQQFQRTIISTGAAEEELSEMIGRARFDISGTSIPPDATFSLRIADGFVRPYRYNGTVSPPYTTFYGLYDRHFAHEAAYADAGESPWVLPERWATPPPELDLATPFNFVTTADIIGGNSGSPVVDRDLRVLGVVFDGNIESLPGEYIFLPESNRSVAVDGRAILAALEQVYGLDWLVRELTTGRLVEMETAEAGGR